MGAAVAAPTEVEQRVAYTSSLNAIASSAMNWYGNLISTDEQVSFAATEQVWDDYRSRYPSNITQIQIMSTDLTKLDVSERYQFKVKSLITYKNTDDVGSQLRDETFTFQVALLAKPVIINIVTDKTEQAKIVSTVKFNRSYYKAREFAYAWLAHLDGVGEMTSVIHAEKWLDNASYSMKIGGDEVEGKISATLAKRKQYLAKGGHLLRSLEVKELNNKSNVFMLDLIIEWEGVNHKGKPVQAKIHQEIEYRIQDNNAWQVISIKEKHLLPDNESWVRLLC